MKVRVQYVFSKTKSPGSFLIRDLTQGLTDLEWNETPSHVSILIKERWIIEATPFGGVKVVPIEKWLESNIMIDRFDCQSVRNYKVVKQKFKSIKGKKYDFPGVIYFGLVIVINGLYSIIPMRDNKWQSDNKFFCSEVIGDLLEIENTDMTSPAQLKETCIKYGLERRPVLTK